VAIEVPGLDEIRHRDGVLAAAKKCLIHNTLLNPPEISIQMKEEPVLEGTP
jgi:hypothetical protein